jgi:hypothetical protein
MIYVDNTSNQLNLTYDTRKDVYAFDSIKSVSFSWDANTDYYVIINFIANDKNNSLRIYLKDVDPGLGWSNDFAGASTAVDDIASWMNEIISAVVDIAKPKGEQISDESVSVVLSSDQFRFEPQPVLIISSGDTATLIGDYVYSISFASNGTAAALVSFDGGANYEAIPTGTTINMDAGGLGWVYRSDVFGYDTDTNAGSSLIITYNK